MRRIYCTAFVLLFLTAMAGPAVAENPIYLTGKLANTTTNDEFGQAFTQIIDGDDEGYSVGLGFKLGKYLAFQAEYHDFGQAGGIGSPCPDDPAIGCIEILVPVEADSTAISVSVLPRWEVSDRFSLYGKFGVVTWDTEVTGILDNVEMAIEDFDDEDLLFGAGLHYQLPGPFGFFAEYENIADAFETVALGATFGF